MEHGELLVLMIAETRFNFTLNVIELICVQPKAESGFSLKLEDA